MEEIKKDRIGILAEIIGALRHVLFTIEEMGLIPGGTDIRKLERALELLKKLEQKEFKFNGRSKNNV